MTAIDVTRARRETPATRVVAHLNNAGSALPPESVTEAVIEHLRRESAVGGYRAAAEAADLVQNVYPALARLLSCQAGEIAVVENATRAWDLAFYSLGFGPGDRILTGRSEYASNAIALLQVARRTGAVIEVIEDDECGQIDLAALERRIGPDVKLISLTHVPTQSGLVNPAAQVGRLARAAGVPYLLDACQSVGQLPLDVEELGCDLLSGTGRKYLRGPRGTGFLYARAGFAEHLEPPFLDLLSAEWISPTEYRVVPGARRFETWEGNVAAKIGLGVAVDYALGWGLGPIEDRVVSLAERLRRELADRPGVSVHDRGRRLCGLVTFTVDGVSAAEVSTALQAAEVNTSVSGAGSSRYDLPHRGLSEVVRASVHYYNDDDDLDRLLAALPKPRARH